MESGVHEVDALIVGGGPAGLAAAKCLGRALKRVLLLDAGAPRHAVSEGVHNLLAREHVTPAALRTLPRGPPPSAMALLTAMPASTNLRAGIDAPERSPVQPFGE